MTDSVNEQMNDKDSCRTAPATTGLLIKMDWAETLMHKSEKIQESFI